MFNTYYKPEPNVPITHLPKATKPKTGNIAQLSAAQAAQGQSTNNPIDTWLAAALLLDNGSPIDALEWWIQQKSAGNTHGGLLQMALDVLSCPGAIWMDELIQNPNPASFYKNMGMTVPTFMKLQALLEEHSFLYNSQHVSSTKKLGTLLYMLITGLSNCKLQQQFQQSASTISGIINQLVKDIASHKKLIQTFIHLPDENTKTPEEIKENPKFSPYFDDCIGAVDGSHIPVFVPNQKRYINQKGYPSQKILEPEDPRGKVATRQCWISFEQHLPDTLPCNKVSSQGLGCSRWRKEIFNLHHSSTRNVVEQIFGVIKSQFQVIEHSCRYNIKLKVKVIIVMTFLQNFIRVTDPLDSVCLNEGEVPTAGNFRIRSIKPFSN
ncbi:hypothetical protein PCASD_24228 [Puccinia coronata f. sp. avenae]|uniref:DUF8040 domain-containing protein n=1 Tax=Puccinia coronata f. sp. avenae TaxID=200324 RepID=A0A2N5ST64_9BASI|nr:hypothetical protein PCASD_24228 [Puccinia coronata f. sp. avenae]